MNFHTIRSKTISTLRNKGIRIDDFNFENLPLLQSTEMRSAQQIALRTAALGLFKLISVYPEDVDWYAEWVKINDFSRYLSDKENSILISQIITEKDEIIFSWYQECLNCAMWILGDNSVSILNFEERNCADLMKHLPPEVELKQFLKTATIRPAIELYEQLDLYYLLHWLSRRLDSIDTSVIRERRRMLEWSLDKHIDNWDHVSLDT
jgi:hypothetical protein